MTRFDRQKEFRVGDMVRVKLSNEEVLNNVDLFLNSFGDNFVGKVVEVRRRYSGPEQQKKYPYLKNCCTVQNNSWRFIIPTCILEKVND